MIDFHTAIELAKKYYVEKGQQNLSRVYDAEKVWIVYAGEKNKIKYGNTAIAIDKETGKISLFVLPNRANFEILKSATLMDV